MNNRSDESTQVFVKKLLGDPDDPDLVFESLTSEQKMGLAISKIAATIDGLQLHGCSRMRRLERKFDIAVKAVGIVGALVGFIYIVVKIAEVAHAAS